MRSSSRELTGRDGIAVSRGWQGLGYQRSAIRSVQSQDAIAPFFQPDVEPWPLSSRLQLLIAPTPLSASVAKVSSSSRSLLAHRKEIFEIAAKLARPRSDYAALAATTESRCCSARPVASWPCAAARQDLTASRSVTAMASGFSVAASDAAFPSAS